MAKATNYYDDTEATDLLREEPTEPQAELYMRLTGKAAVDHIAAAIRANEFQFDPDDHITLATAEALQVVDADEYARGFDLLNELSTLEDRISKHYSRFDKPLNFLIQVVRGLKGPQAKQVAPVKKALSERLGTWRTLQDRRDRERQQAEQRARDLAARAAQDARAASLARVAELETNPDIAESLRKEADAVRAQEVAGPPVELVKTAPAVSGHTRVYWACEFLDLKALMKAYVEGQCFIPDEALITDGLQSYMDDQAASLQENLGKAYPGTRAVRSERAVGRRR